MDTPQDKPQTVDTQSLSGILHRYAGDRVAFEHTGGNNKGRPRAQQNILVWVGGLGDRITSVDYTIILALSLPSNWTLISLGLSSEGSGWGTGSLKRDSEEIAEFVQYWKNSIADSNKVVLMGHSTGCQDAMEYVGPHHSLSDTKPDFDLTGQWCRF
jgi:hypothetical protein